MLRNHPTVIIRHVLNFLWVIIIALFVWVLPNIEENTDLDRGFVIVRSILPIAAIVAVVLFIMYRRWKLTTFTFGPDEITVERNTLFRLEKHIQYSKLASVNVRRGLFCRITGTSDLLFNINSTVNTAQAEAVLTLKEAEANELRESVSRMVFRKEMTIEEDKNEESLVRISNVDIILHGLLSQPTLQAIVGIVFGAYTVISVVRDGFVNIPAAIIFVFSTVWPWVKTILKYYNYRIYRSDDTITVESGLISTYRTSFSTKKINSVRVRSPLLARVVGRSLLEAEVIGLANGDGMPLLCPLKNNTIVQKLAHDIVPEFIDIPERESQPKGALVPTMLGSLMTALVFAAIGAIVLIDAMFRTDHLTVRYLIAAGIGIAIPVLVLLHGYMAHHRREIGMGDGIFMFTIGAFDIETDYILFDKVQICTLSSDIFERRYGMGRCTVSLMSASGKKELRSGIFAKESLAPISEEIMTRIKDGRYDYRRYQ